MSGHSTDQELKQRVRSLLAKDKDLRGYGINADVVEGEVQLQGIVDSLREKERAGKIVRQFPGVKGVANAISISTDGAISDKDVMMEVTEELAQDPKVDLRHIGVANANRGTVVLKGQTDNKKEIAAARRAASKARGVTRVVSQVKSPEEKLTLEEIFHSQVRNDQENEELT